MLHWKIVLYDNRNKSWQEKSGGFHLRFLLMLPPNVFYSSLGKYLYSSNCDNHHTCHPAWMKDNSNRCHLPPLSTQWPYYCRPQHDRLGMLSVHPPLGHCLVLCRLLHSLPKHLRSLMPPLQETSRWTESRYVSHFLITRYQIECWMSNSILINKPILCYFLRISALI